MNEAMIQIIGFIAALLFIISYQIKSNRALFLLQLMGSAMFCLQFMLLGAFSGCFSLIVVIIRNALLLKYNQWQWVRWKGWLAVFVAAYLIILYFTWESPLSILPVAAVIGGTIGYWTNNAQKIRFANLVCCSPCWIIYDVIVGSWGGVLSESVTLLSVLISIYRYGWRAMGDADSGFDR